MRASNDLLVILMPFLLLAGCSGQTGSGCDALAFANSGNMKAFERWVSAAASGSWRCRDVPLIVAVSDTAHADEAVRILLQHGGNATEVDPHSQRTALHNLADGGALALAPAKMLLERDANPNAQDAKGVTPLMTVAGTQGVTNDVQMVELLLKWGAVPTMKDRNGRTAAQYAESARNTTLQRLLEKVAR